MEDGTERLAIFCVFLLSVTSLSCANSKMLFVDALTGDDSNRGTIDKPLKTLGQAAKLANRQKKPGPATIRLSPGIYNLSQTVVFDNQGKYTQKNRLTIEAGVLPDDPKWKPSLMPVILSTQDPRDAGHRDKHTETYSLKIKTSHVTIRGLKFLGNPLSNNWHACIERVEEYLDDLVVSQCMFVGDRDALNIYSPVIATGDRLIVDHCVFYGCHASVVYWDGLEGIGGKGCAMRYCIVKGGHIASVWTCQTAEDFQFQHNVITGCEYFWMRKSGDRQEYRIENCILTTNKHYSGYGTAAGATGQTGPEVTFNEKDVIKEGKLILEKNKKEKNYLHIVQGSLASELGAGIFRK
jgi:hypothetical protein